MQETTAIDRTADTTARSGRCRKCNAAGCLSRSLIEDYRGVEPDRRGRSADVRRYRCFVCGHPHTVVVERVQ